MKGLALAACLIGAGRRRPRAGDSKRGCVRVTIAYPGDVALKEEIAGWMAHGARARGVPGELPVMAAWSSPA